MWYFKKETKNPFGLENQGIKQTATTGGKNQHIVLRTIKERLKKEVKQKLSHLIKPINAEAIREFVPMKEMERTFFLMNGNCQFADFIFELVKVVNEPLEEATFTTLSVNDHTFEVIEKLGAKKNNLLVSSYFLATDKANTLPELKKKGKLDGINIGFFRNHTKISLLRFKSGKMYILCGSANLRSSATIEQFTIELNSDLYKWNYDWVLRLIEIYNFDKEYENQNINTGPASFNHWF